MKFIVDEMPKSKSKCHFSEWKPYPPIMEKTGHYICKINHDDCNLCETECQLLKAVVLCKDCDNKECWGRAGDVVCGIDGMPHRPDWFCADGERRDS